MSIAIVDGEVGHSIVRADRTSDATADGMAVGTSALRELRMLLLPSKTIPRSASAATPGMTIVQMPDDLQPSVGTGAGISNIGRKGSRRLSEPAAYRPTRVPAEVFFRVAGRSSQNVASSNEITFAGV